MLPDRVTDEAKPKSRAIKRSQRRFLFAEDVSRKRARHLSPVRGGASRAGSTSQLYFPYVPFPTKESVIEFFQYFLGYLLSLIDTKRDFSYSGYLYHRECDQLNKMIFAQCQRMKLMSTGGLVDPSEAFFDMFDFLGYVVLKHNVAGVQIGLPARQNLNVPTLEANKQYLLRAAFALDGLDKNVLISDERKGSSVTAIPITPRKIKAIQWRKSLMIIFCQKPEDDFARPVSGVPPKRVQMKLGWVGPYTRMISEKRGLLTPWHTLPLFSHCIKIDQKLPEDYVAKRRNVARLVLDRIVFGRLLVQTLNGPRHSAAFSAMDREGIIDRFNRELAAAEAENKKHPDVVPQSFINSLNCIRVQNTTPDTVIYIRGTNQDTYVLATNFALEIHLALTDIVFAELHVLSTGEIIALKTSMVSVVVEDDILEVRIKAKNDLEVLVQVLWYGPLVNYSTAALKRLLGVRTRKDAAGFESQTGGIFGDSTMPIFPVGGTPRSIPTDYAHVEDVAPPEGSRLRRYAGPYTSFQI